MKSENKLICKIIGFFHLTIFICRGTKKSDEEKQVLEGYDGVRNIHDDITVHGQTKEEHDKRLHEALERIQNRGLTLNKEKCKFHLSELAFMGHLLSARRIGPSQAKVEAVTEARQTRVSSRSA